MWPNRALTVSEHRLAESTFGTAIDLEAVRLNLRKWWPFQPKKVAMAPQGELWFHPEGNLYCDCFAAAPLSRQGFFIHELVHVWQHQQGICLPLRRYPFSRYSYTLIPGKAFGKYGIEQQAEIVRHAFLLRNGVNLIGKPDLEVYENLLPFKAQL